MDSSSLCQGDIAEPLTLSLNEAQLDILGRRVRKESWSVLDKLRSERWCSGPRLKSCFFSCVPVLSWLPRYSLRQNAIGDLVSGISVGIMHLPQVGTFSILAIMIGTVLGDLKLLGNRGDASESDADMARVSAAAQLTIMCGLIQMVLSVLHCGGVCRWLSRPLVGGYTTAAAIHVTIHQLPLLAGIAIDRHAGVCAVFWMLGDVLSGLDNASPGALIVSAVSMVTLVGGKVLNSYFKKHLPMPIPWELVLVILATILSWQLDLLGNYRVQVVGTVPTGLSAPSLPPLSLSQDLLLPAFALAVVGFGFTASLGTMFALKHGYTIDSNQELLAMGLCNSIGGVFQCFAVSTSMSRSMVQESTGGKTQVSALVSALLMLVILLKVGALFEQLPKAVLAVIILVNLQGIFVQVKDVPALWATDRVDLCVWVVTALCALVFNLDLGLGAAMAFSVLTVVFRTQRSQSAALGVIPGTDCYRDLKLFSEARQIPGVTIFSFCNPIYYANSDPYFNSLEEVIQRGLEENACPSEAPPGQQTEVRQHCVILELSGVSFMDSVAMNKLRTMVKECGNQGIWVLLAACPDGLLTQLQTQGLVPVCVSCSSLFPSVHHAVQHCHHTLLSVSPSHNTATIHCYLTPRSARSDADPVSHCSCPSEANAQESYDTHLALGCPP
ncbi:solute carrier family 26 member 6 isoform X2 [Alosa sapidissima]|uniref:solute carrier family 26 member 6 isoform X2 n=1 Tax=Alosa sapidissima TaxID=34773 RepID=UPI001C0A61B9|nr:solute carrier family 26 member 6 isoform X2 [Alosa sapidissima]